MKSYRIKKWLYVLVVPIIIAACETNRETFDEFVKNGETLYIGKPENVTINHGFAKLRFNIELNSDPKISKGTITSLDGSVNHEFTIERTQKGNEVITEELSNLEEREYSFNITLEDNNGNGSLGSEVLAKVYGEKYQSTLLVRAIKSIDAENGDVVIAWDDALDGNVNTTFTYMDTSGAMQTVNVGSDETKITLPTNITPLSDYTIESFYIPISGAFEAFKTKNAFQGTFPILLTELDKANFAVVKLPNDIAGTKAGGSLTKLYDGNIGGNNFYHSDPTNDPMPQHFTLDLGVSSNIAEIEIYGRTGGKSSIEKNPRILEIWGINDLAGAETMLPSDDPGWEQESLSKGWVKLSEVTHPNVLNDAPTTYTMKVSDQNPSVRYIRFRVLATWRADKKASHLSEITVKSSKIN